MWKWVILEINSVLLWLGLSYTTLESSTLLVILECGGGEGYMEFSGLSLGIDVVMKLVD